MILNCLPLIKFQNLIDNYIFKIKTISLYLTKEGNHNNWWILYRIRKINLSLLMLIREYKQKPIPRSSTSLLKADSDFQENYQIIQDHSQKKIKIDIKISQNNWNKCLFFKNTYLNKARMRNCNNYINNLKHYVNNYENLNNFNSSISNVIIFNQIFSFCYFATNCCF